MYWEHKRNKKKGNRRHQLEAKLEKLQKGVYNSQRFQRGLNVRKFEEVGHVRNSLIVKHEADAPDNWREADVLGAGQIVQNNIRLL